MPMPELTNSCYIFGRGSRVPQPPTAFQCRNLDRKRSVCRILCTVGGAPSVSETFEIPMERHVKYNFAIVKLVARHELADAFVLAYFLSPHQRKAQS
jgi:hypothetical protein